MRIEFSDESFLDLVRGLSSDRSIDWLIDFAFDRLIERLIVWLIGGLIDWLIDWLIGVSVSIFITVSGGFLSFILVKHGSNPGTPSNLVW